MTTYIELARKQHELQTKYEQIKNHYTREESLLMFEIAACNKQLKQMQKTANVPIVRNKNSVENPLRFLTGKKQNLLSHPFHFTKTNPKTTSIVYCNKSTNYLKRTSNMLV